MWEIFGVLNLTLHHTGTDGKMPLLILRTELRRTLLSVKLLSWYWSWYATALQKLILIFIWVWLWTMVYDPSWLQTEMSTSLHLYYCQGQVLPAEAQPPTLGSPSATGEAATTVTLEPGVQRHELWSVVTSSLFSTVCWKFVLIDICYYLYLYLNKWTRLSSL